MRTSLVRISPAGPDGYLLTVERGGQTSQHEVMLAPASVQSGDILTGPLRPEGHSLTLAWVDQPPGFEPWIELDLLDTATRLIAGEEIPLPYDISTIRRLRLQEAEPEEQPGRRRLSWGRRRKS